MIFQYEVSVFRDDGYLWYLYCQGIGATRAGVNAQKEGHSFERV